MATNQIRILKVVGSTADDLLPGEQHDGSMTTDQMRMSKGDGSNADDEVISRRNCLCC